MHTATSPTCAGRIIRVHNVQDVVAQKLYYQLATSWPGKTNYPERRRRVINEIVKLRKPNGRNLLDRQGVERDF